MLKNTRSRRALAVALIVLGGVLMYLWLQHNQDTTSES